MPGQKFASIIGMLLLSCIVLVAADVPHREIAPGVFMPVLSLGHPDDGSTETVSAEVGARK
jgi:hypothetical protein